MTPEQQAAYIIAQAMCAAGDIAGMQAANAACAAASADSSGTLVQPFKEKDFTDVALRYGIHHNAVISFFTGRS